MDVANRQRMEKQTLYSTLFLRGNQHIVDLLLQRGADAAMPSAGGLSAKRAAEKRKAQGSAAAAAMAVLGADVVPDSVDPDGEAAPGGRPVNSGVLPVRTDRRGAPGPVSQDTYNHCRWHQYSDRFGPDFSISSHFSCHSNHGAALPRATSPAPAGAYRWGGLRRPYRVS